MTVVKLSEKVRKISCNQFLSNTSEPHITQLIEIKS